MNQKLESDLKSKLVVLVSQKNSVSEEIEFLENMKNELETQIKDSPKNVLIAKSEDLIQMLKEINNKPNFKFNPSGINFTFRYFSHFLLIHKNVSKLKNFKKKVRIGPRI